MVIDAHRCVQRILHPGLSAELNSYNNQ